MILTYWVSGTFQGLCFGDYLPIGANGNFSGAMYVSLRGGTHGHFKGKRMGKDNINPWIFCFFKTRTQR